jgi:hypothetical protein
MMELLGIPILERCLRRREQSEYRENVASAMNRDLTLTYRYKELAKPTQRRVFLILTGRMMAKPTPNGRIVRKDYEPHDGTGQVRPLISRRGGEHYDFISERNPRPGEFEYGLGLIFVIRTKMRGRMSLFAA